ncbi:hypothetical protein [Nostoc sp. NMS4]|uniref:hypothetical protein n=1 Tax=Nostoc sp. NMS4 TaxID=2815390 RepID=UPI00260141BC|nr:hypothetical protein [Nostoc sp. NMS4]
MSKESYLLLITSPARGAGELVRNAGLDVGWVEQCSTQPTNFFATTHSIEIK